MKNMRCLLTVQEPGRQPSGTITGPFVFIPLVDEGILVARSSDSYGEFQLNMLCERKGWIDSCPFWDEDGKAYMIFAYAGSRAGIKHRLMLVEIDPDCRELIGEPVLIFDGEQIAPTTEDPRCIKRRILLRSDAVRRSGKRLAVLLKIQIGIWTL